MTQSLEDYLEAIYNLAYKDLGAGRSVIGPYRAGSGGRGAREAGRSVIGPYQTGCGGRGATRSTVVRGASVRSVASRLGVKMPSVVKAVRDLKGMGLVLQQPYGPIELTDEGLRLAQDVQKRHVLLRAFLEKLGVSTLNADRDACMMEHILSAETLDRIRSYMARKD